MKMNFRNVLLIATIGLVFSACGGKSKTTEQSNELMQTNDLAISIVEIEEVPYVEVKNYFVNNSYKETGLKTITDQATFDSIFGMAATMDQDGKPTLIDFEKNYVIAIIGETSNLQPEIMVNRVEKDGDKIIVNYSLIEKKETSFTMQPTAILIIDKKYSGGVELALDIADL